MSNDRIVVLKIMETHDGLLHFLSKLVSQEAADRKISGMYGND
jgi:hypothetical protein